MRIKCALIASAEWRHSVPKNCMATYMKHWFANLWIAIKTFRIHTQENRLGFPLEILPDYAFKWTWDTRRMYFFRSYMGWSNLSDGHRADQCHDAAYCQWHGSL